ncbi:MAG: hypothetical protein MR488_04850 [Lachnospiraceae bacterium]|nr:hypothetical protein [Lachnospiraceae bacterium]
MDEMRYQKLLEALEYYAELVSKQQEAMETMAHLISQQGELIAQLQTVQEVSDAEKLRYTD